MLVKVMVGDDGESDELAIGMLLVVVGDSEVDNEWVNESFNIQWSIKVEVPELPHTIPYTV